MARIRFMDASRNLWIVPGAVLVASSEAVALPAGNTQHPDRTKIWRSVTGTGTPTLDIDLLTAQAVTCLAVANVKLVGTGVLELYQRGSSGTAGAATLLATLPAQDRDTRTAFVFFGSQSFRHWQLKWTNPTAASDYADLGYVHLGTYFEPTQNPTVPAEIVRQDPSVESLSVDGQATFARRTKVFRGAWTLEEVPEAQLDTYRAFWDALGASGTYFQVLDTSLPWTSWYARVTGSLGIQLGVMAGRYNLGLPWQEVR